MVSQSPHCAGNVSVAAADLEPFVRATVTRTLRLPARHPDVDDCVQEALTRALDGLKRPGAVLSRAWLAGIAKHVAIDALREKRRRPLVSTAGDGDDTSDAIAEIAEDRADPARQALVSQEVANLARALNAFPPAQQKATLMFHAEGRSYQEIASELGVPVGTVATWICRVRIQLNETLRAAEVKP